MSRDNRPPIRKQPKLSLPLMQFVLLGLSIASGLMLAMALPNLLSGDGTWLLAKSILIATAATIVSYATGRLAIERGAPLAAIGYTSAGILAVGSILFVGAGQFTATYAGLVFRDAAELELQAHGSDVAAHVAGRVHAAAKAGRAGAVVGAIVSDLTEKRDCEVRVSCLSGYAEGGRGPVARTLAEKLGKAQAIALEVDRGAAAREAATTDLNKLIGRYQDTLASNEDIWRRRSQLQEIDAQIRQKVADLDEAAPVSLLAAYAEDLAAGAALPEQPEANRRLNTILRAHARSLAAALESSDAAARPYPPFPRRTGVMETFAYLGHFAPIAAITAVVELVFPLTLWVYTLLSLLWESYRREPPTPPAPRRIDQFCGLLDDPEDMRRIPEQPRPALRAPDRPLIGRAPQQGRGRRGRR